MTMVGLTMWKVVLVLVNRGYRGLVMMFGDQGMEMMIMSGLAMWRMVLVMMSRGYRGLVMMLVTEPGRR